jgi:hypothetical protein
MQQCHHPMNGRQSNERKIDNKTNIVEDILFKENDMTIYTMHTISMHVSKPRIEDFKQCIPSFLLLPISNCGTEVLLGWLVRGGGKQPTYTKEKNTRNHRMPDSALW